MGIRTVVSVFPVLAFSEAMGTGVAGGAFQSDSTTEGKVPEMSPH